MPQKPEQSLSSEERTPLQLYLREIGKTPLLTVEEETKLAAQIKKGSQKAKDKLVQANLRLVVKIASDYSHFGLPLTDLICEGNIGLMKAADRFDPSKGGKFSTYASWWVKQAIKRALSSQSKTIRLPAHMVARAYHMRQIITQLETKLKRDPTNEEVAAEMKLPVSKVAHLRDVMKQPTSLDSPIGENGESTLGEIIGDENSPEPNRSFLFKSNIDEVNKLISYLGDREAQLLELRFGLNGQKARTLEETGEIMGLTRERVRQLQMAVLKRLRELIEDQDRERTPEEIYQEKKLKAREQVKKEFIDNLLSKKVS